MQILVTGANGFIGSHIVAALLKQGHQVICAARAVANTQRRFPNCRVIGCDFNHDTKAEIWRERLTGVDAVINVVGILQSTGHNKIHRIHAETPCALFQACKDVGVKKVIQISALGAAADAPTDYGRSKNAADEFLMGLGIDADIVRPSLVYSTGSYGGTSLFRGLAGMPLMTPLVGKGEQRFQPIHVDDLSKAILHLLQTPHEGGRILDAVGPNEICMRDLILKLRHWLGLGKSFVLSTPLFAIRAMAKLGDIWGGIPINTTAYKMLQLTQCADGNPFWQAVGFKPRAFDTVLNEQPAQTQDLWQARLYFIRPLLRFAIGLLWLLSGIVSLTVSRQFGVDVLEQFGLGMSLSYALIIVAAGADIILGIFTLIAWRLEWVGTVQIILMLIYTVLASFIDPSLWSNPFAPLVKNIPLIAATLVMIVLAKER